MYLAEFRGAVRLSREALRRIAVGNVLALGTVSLLTDISAEMVTAVLPAYLVLGLHLSLVQYGVLDGIYTGATAVTRLVGGYLADRWRRRKAVAGVGYALSALAKVGLLTAPAAPAALGTVIALDRTGKGLRTAPRDALIASAVPGRDLGAAFGLHRAMDGTGAFLGPLVALGLLLLAGTQAYDTVFVGSLCAATLGLLVLVLFVRERQQPDPAVAVTPPATLRGRELLANRGLQRLCVVAALLGLVTIGDGFVFLMLQDRHDLPVVAFPLLAVGTSLAYLLLAIPLGRAADRAGRWKVVVGGYGCLVAVYLLLAIPAAPVVVVVVLYGAFYAATDGVLAALVVPLLPAGLTTTGLALVQTGQALAYLVSSVLFGLLWSRVGATQAALLAALAAALLLPLAASMLRRAPAAVRP